MAQAFADGGQEASGPQQARGHGMPTAMIPEVGDPGILQQLGPFFVEEVAAPRAAVGIGEDPFRMRRMGVLLLLEGFHGGR